MKTIIVILSLLLSVINLNAKEIKAGSKIKSVTVFRNGAQINRTANVYLKKGRHEVVFSNLAKRLNPQSIQVSGKGSVTIVAVYHRLNYLKKIKENRRIKSMRDSVKLLSKKIDYINSNIKVYNEEAALIKFNKQIGGTQTGMKVADLQAAADFYRKRLTFIYTKVLDLQYKKKELTELKNKLQNQINILSSKPQKAVSEIVVEVVADISGNAVFSLNYVTLDAGWNPEYDIRAKDIKSPVELHARALVFQNTGIDWNNVNLTISSGNPNRSGVIPVLYKWYLYYRTGNSRNSGYGRPVNAATAKYEKNETDDYVAESKYVSGNRKSSLFKNSADFTKTTETQTNVKYTISFPYNIPSSGKTIRIKIRKFKLNSTYRYFCVPKLNTDVFLQARITGWEDLNLIPGNVNIFFEDSYVSKSYLNTNNFMDTLNISLGVDKSIIVKREKIKDKNRKSVMGGKNKIIRSWKITVRNTKSTNIHLVIEDQIPVSSYKEIEVQLLEKSDAKYNEETGKLVWETDIKPRTNVEKDFAYQVKYPKDYYLTNME